MNNKAFTLIELLLAMLVMSIIISLTYPAFIDLLSASKVETASSEAHIDKITGIELIRMDLEHANYGIGLNEATVPITWDSVNKTLQLNSTLNNTNQSTIGWMLYDCTGGGTLAKTSSNLLEDRRQDDTNTCFALLDSDRNLEGIYKTTDGCPANKIFTAFPLSETTANPCKSRNFGSVQYKLSSGTNTLSDCAKGTKNLLRQVDASITGEPILNCVADMTVTFDLDTDGDGAINTFSATSPPTTSTAAVLNQVKNINMYVLMQTGRKDENLNSNETLNIDVALSKAGITEDASKYRWKVVRISGKPMSW